MKKLNLLKSLPKPKRNIQNRSDTKDPEIIKKAKEYGEMYWDGPREYGYGGYTYDGRWRSVAKNIINYYELSSKMKVLDIGCGKGFLVKDLMLECSDLDVYGLDISEYALMKADTELTGRLHIGSADKLIFPDNTFDFVISLNTIHNLSKDKALNAIKEIERVSKGKSFIQVDSYLTERQKEIFESWVLTADYHDFPEGWLNLFKKAGYTGDYDWTIIE